jgi:hypothetical protein
LQKPNVEDAVRKAKAALLSDPATIRQRYGNKPITLLQMIDGDMRFPKKLRTIFACLWLQVDLQGRPATRFIMKGPRGGGKSKMLGALGFVKWYLQLRNAIDMGGSLEQAKGVYNYFTGHIFASEAIADSLPDEPTMLRTKTDKGNYFRAVAASQKQVRGPHPDVLFADEACEIKDDLLLSAMPMVDSSPNPLVVMTSTFHKIFGLFQETWDRADELGWARLSWDAFDVVKEFNPRIWDDPQLNRQIPDLAKLRKRAAGRTGDPEGWIPVENLIQAWREKPSEDYFDVEYMGSRPSAEGMVNDPEDVDACTVGDLESAGLSYRPGAETAGGIDWGFQGMTVWDVEMAAPDNVLVELVARHYTQVRSSVIIEDVVADVLRYRIRTIHVDASHPFENADLRAAITQALNALSKEQQFRCSVVEVPFGRPIQIAERDKTGAERDVNHKQGTEKEAMLGNYRARWQRRLNRVPASNRVGLWQHKRYRYQENSDKPLKEDDHYPDSKMLAQRRWMLGKSVSKMTEHKPAIHRTTFTGGLMDQQF